ncbi:DUF58 domain-containing protein [Microbacterium sp. NIBRBAC000506063]|uniref:DUF58 domain-containing protein n=1 Tax=Microbacterium sp. NIBRBAC000506063 TaxID=2734618 RepID=UPI001BB699D5|nr:DUF58 domain-containing protein [Microbacterium sp. NIBRBAC000506063]QTV80052.1 DUF58 domain-containing protein [Microbacterium sp. NIBRBAC000506063]
MRRIHWRATAHRGDLMVRQEEEEASPDALVVLDLSPARWEHAGEGPDPRFELAVSACASAAIQLAADGYAVDVLDASGAQLGVLRGNEEDADELLVALATVDPAARTRCRASTAPPSARSSSSPGASRMPRISCPSIRRP